MVGSFSHWLAYFLMRFNRQSMHNGWIMVGSFPHWLADFLMRFNGWIMVGSFSHWIGSLSIMVGRWLADFLIRFNALFISMLSAGGGENGWPMVGFFSTLIEKESASKKKMVG